MVDGCALVDNFPAGDLDTDDWTHVSGACNV